MPINMPYTPEFFRYTLGQSRVGKDVQSFGEFKVGENVTADIFFTEALDKLGYQPDQPILVDRLLVGELGKHAHCLLNGRLPCGTIISANVQFFKPITI